MESQTQEDSLVFANDRWLDSLRLRRSSNQSIVFAQDQHGLDQALPEDAASDYQYQRTQVIGSKAGGVVPTQVDSSPTRDGNVALAKQQNLSGGENSAVSLPRGQEATDGPSWLTHLSANGNGGGLLPTSDTQYATQVLEPLKETQRCAPPQSTLSETQVIRSTSPSRTHAPLRTRAAATKTANHWQPTQHDSQPLQEANHATGAIQISSIPSLTASSNPDCTIYPKLSPESSPIGNVAPTDTKGGKSAQVADDITKTLQQTSTSEPCTPRTPPSESHPLLPEPRIIDPASTNSQDEETVHSPATEIRPRQDVPNTSLDFDFGASDQDAVNITFNTTIGTSPKLEPHTQVANTQEDLFSTDHDNSVDLGCKPVFSSSQNDDRRAVNLSVVSNDCDSEVESTPQSYENLLLWAKRRRVVLDPLQSSDEIHESPDKEVDMEGASEQFPRASTPGDEPMLERDSLNSKRSLSQSSSELEDVSQDHSGLDLNALTFRGTPQHEPSPLVREARLTRNGAHTNDIASSTTPDDDENLPKLDAILAETSHILPWTEIRHPEAVWAFSQFKYYPARILEYGQNALMVEFGDLQKLEVRNNDLQLLDIRVGDNINHRSRTEEFVVVGLSSQSQLSPFVCIRGYDTVILRKRKGRLTEDLCVPIYDVCMELSEWALHQQDFVVQVNDLNLLLEPYSVFHSFMEDSQHVVEPTHESAVSVISPKKTRKLAPGLFDGMLFFVTSLEDARKERLETLISQNGGTFVDDEIRKYVGLSRSSTGALMLSLHKLSQYTFGALLADGPSRSAKYLQALAMGWPILGDNFIELALQDPDLLDNWRVFLLPAGQLAYTCTVTNLNVKNFCNSDAGAKTLAQQLTNNAHLLSAYSMAVLGSRQESTMLDMCCFIFHALGARKMTLCNTVEEVDALLRRSQDQVMVYDNPLGDFERRSRYRGEVGIVDWEWVVQCVISGYIWKTRVRTRVK